MFSRRARGLLGLFFLLGLTAQISWRGPAVPPPGTPPRCPTGYTFDAGRVSCIAPGVQMCDDHSICTGGRACRANPAGTCSAFGGTSPSAYCCGDDGIAGSIDCPATCNGGALPGAICGDTFACGGDRCCNDDPGSITIPQDERCGYLGGDDSAPLPGASNPQPSSSPPSNTGSSGSGCSGPSSGASGYCFTVTAGPIAPSSGCPRVGQKVCKATQSICNDSRSSTIGLCSCRYGVSRCGSIKGPDPTLSGCTPG